MFSFLFPDAANSDGSCHHRVKACMQFDMKSEDSKKTQVKQELPFVSSRTPVIQGWDEVSRGSTSKEGNVFSF